jgi:UDP-arabinose 4-epimerase
MSQTVLVTGGAGYIGSHVCKELRRLGIVPVAIDNLVYGHEWAVKWGPLVKGDIADCGLLDRTMREYKPAAVIHLAAFAYVGESVGSPAKYYRNNVAGAISLLESMVENGVKKIVFSSSCATYGVPETVPIDERHSQRPINPYGRTKLIVEEMLRDFGAAYSLRHCSLRYFNAAGADPDGETGEAHDPETHLIPNALGAAFGELPALEIYGDAWPTPDGTCVRDYIHVSDLAGAHVKALEFLDTTEHGAFNLGTGQGTSVLQVVKAVENGCGKKVPVRFVPPRPGDPAVLVADATKAKTELGWTARMSDIGTIVKTACGWNKKRKKAARV